MIKFVFSKVTVDCCRPSPIQSKYSTVLYVDHRNTRLQAVSLLSVDTGMIPNAGKSLPVFYRQQWKVEVVMSDLLSRERYHEGSYYSRSFSPSLNQGKERSQSAPPRSRIVAAKKMSSPNQSKQRVPWIPNASQSNYSHNRITKKYHQNKRRVTSRGISSEKKISSPKVGGFSGPTSPHIVETFIGGKRHSYKVHSPLSSPHTPLQARK